MNNKTAYWILFLINPFIAVIISLNNFKLPYAKNIFWAFCIFYGLSFSIGKESSTSDINRYVTELERLHKLEYLSFDDALEIFSDSGEVDILRSIISFVLSRFTDKQAILTMIYALIFGFFYSRNIWYVFNLLNGKLNFITKIFLFALILLVPIWSINGFRMYTAFHIFMFGLLPYIFESRKNNLIFVFLSALVHFSFLVPISIILLYFIIGNRIKLIFSFFVISIFISEFDLGMMNRYVETYLPEVLIERSSSYRSEATIENREENVGKINRNWYAMFYQELLRWAVISFLFYFFFIARKVIQNKKDLLRLFTLTLLFYIAANILSYLPSGARYYSFANFLGLIFIILYSYYYSNDYKFIRLTYLSSPAILIFIIISVRIGLYSISITTLFGNPLIAILGIGNNISINDLIK